MTYTLASESMRVVERNDKGLVTYRKRYKKGDEIDTDHLPEGRLEQLLAGGDVVEGDADGGQDDADGEAAEAQALEDSRLRGDAARTGSVSPTSSEGVPLQEGDVALNPEQDETVQESDDAEDEYTDMEYSALQTEAKERGLNAGGSADELRARLRQDDTEE